MDPSYLVELLSDAHIKKSIREFNFLSKPSSIKCIQTQISHNLAPSRYLRYFSEVDYLSTLWAREPWVGRWINRGRYESLKAQERGETKAK